MQWPDVEMELCATGNDHLAEWVHDESEAMKAHISALREGNPDYRGACSFLFRMGYLWADGQWYLPMRNRTKCQACGEGHLTPMTESHDVAHQGEKGTVTLRYAECDSCGSELTGDADGRANKQAVADFRLKIERWEE